jgi:hypothetical protein
MREETLNEKMRKDAETTTNLPTLVLPTTIELKFESSSEKIQKTTELTTKMKTTKKSSVPLDKVEVITKKAMKISTTNAPVKAPNPETPNHYLKWFFGKFFHNL